MGREEEDGGGEGGGGRRREIGQIELAGVRTQLVSFSIWQLNLKEKRVICFWIICKSEYYSIFSINYTFFDEI